MSKKTECCKKHKKKGTPCRHCPRGMQPLALAVHLALALPLPLAQAQTETETETETETATRSADVAAELPELMVSAGANLISRYVGASSYAAARLPADPLDLPVSGTSISRAVIEDQGIIRAAEAVRNVSGVTRSPAYLGLTDSYRIRGFPADIGLWNGFRRDFYYSFTDTAHLERIEVIKGPASVTYGDLEPGGVVNYVTKRPSRDPVQSVKLTVGSYDLWRPEFDVGFAGGEDESVRLRVTGAHEEANSFRDHVDSQLSTLGATFDWDISPATRVEVSGYWFDSEVVPDRGFFNSLGPLVLDLPPERFLGEPADSYTFEQKDVSVQVTHRLNEDWSLRGGINWYQVEDVRDNIQLRDLQPDGRTIRRQYTYVPGSNEYLTVFAETSAELTLGATQHTLVAGFERIEKDNFYDFRRDRSSDYALDIFAPVYGQSPRIRAPNDRYDTDSTSDGFYLQDLIALGEHWRFLAGVRYSRFEQEDRALDAGTDATQLSQSETTPRLGVLYRLTPEDSVFASYGRSFAPQIYNYAFLSPGVEPKPEEGEQYEIGYKHTALDESLVAGITAFQIKKQNVATTDPNDTDFYVLSGEQTVRGIEVDVSAKLGAGWSLIGSYAWLDGFVSEDNDIPEGDRLVNTPHHQGSLWVRHDFAAVPGLGLGVGAYAVGDREAELPNTWTIPGYTRFDASLFWEVSPQLDVALHVKNLTDKTYYDSQSNLLYPGAPRSALLNVQYKF